MQDVLSFLVTALKEEEGRGEEENKEERTKRRRRRALMGAFNGCSDSHLSLLSFLHHLLLLCGSQLAPVPEMPCEVCLCVTISERECV